MAKRGENIYKRKDGRYEGRFIKGRHQDGKPIFGYLYAHTYAEVKSALTFAKAKTKQHEKAPVLGKGSLAEFLNYWMAHVVKERVKASTYAQYHERVAKYIIPALGQYQMRSISKEQVQGFADELAGRGLATSTVTNIMRVLYSALNKASELRMISAKPCDGVTLPRTVTQERRALERIEQIKLEQMAEQEEDCVQLGVFLSLYAGLRIGEVCAIRWRDVDFSTGTLTVQGTLQRVKDFSGGERKTTLMESSPKSRRSLRKIPLPTGLSSKLRRHGKTMPADFFILSGSEKPVEPRTLRSRFNRVAQKAGLEIPFHALRHTYATRCLENNFDIQTLSELLGHADANITMRVYAHSVFEHKRQLTKRIRILSEIKKPSDEPSEIGATH